MKKILILLMLWIFPAQAQFDVLDAKTENSDKRSFNSQEQESPSEVVNEYITDLENAARVQKNARDLLLQKNTSVSLRENQKKQIEEGNKKRELLKQKINGSKEFVAQGDTEEITIKENEQREILKNSLNKAPFGLYWQASKEDLQILGFDLFAAQRDGYKNVYEVKKTDKPIENFAFVTVAFGEKNRLWNIYAQGVPQDDDKKASKVLALYNKYYNALEKKYGNAKQIFQPYIEEKEVSEKDDEKAPKKIIKQEHVIGNDNFLHELQEEKAVLYATFNDEKIGVILGVGVNQDEQSYITLDYKNLLLLKKEQEQNMQEMLENL